MDFEVLRQAVCVNELIYEGSVEQSVDSDLTLPDYCPDILRILKCTVTPRVTGSQVSGERITVDGTVLVRLIYVGEDARVRCFEQNLPFSKYVEVKNLPDSPCVSVRLKAEYVNCRAVSQRRADIHGTVSVNISVTVRRVENLSSGVDGCGVQLQKKTQAASSAVGLVERMFPLTEVLEIGESKAPVGQIIRCNAIALAQDIKVIQNKCLIKGELAVKTLYCADTNENELETIEHTMPISQIVEVDGIDEDCGSDIRLEVMGLEVTPKSDSSGELRLLDMNVRVCACVRAYREVEVPVVTDAYSTQYELTVEQKGVDLDQLIEIFNETSLCKNTVSLSGTSVTKVLDLWCSDVTANSSFADGMLTVSGTVTVCMLVLDHDAQPNYLERPVDFEYQRALKSDAQKIRCDPTVQVTALDYVLNASDQMEVRIELNITSSVFCSTSLRLITEIRPNEEQIKRSTSAALTIYFSDAGESVWNIARRYNTTMEAIMRENHLESEQVPEKCMLLIPGI